jgi:prevent-host-death family protein
VREVTVSEAAEDNVLEDLVDEVCSTHQPVWLTDGGLRVAVLIALEDYNEMLRATGRPVGPQAEPPGGRRSRRRRRPGRIGSR